MSELAVVTGATGMVGKIIVLMLLERGYRVRILTRNTSFQDSRLEIIYGDLGDTAVIEKLLHGAEYLFHCAAELNDETKMWQTNVIGTQNLIQSTVAHQIKYICCLSSVGVIGKFSGTVADEKASCVPLNMYEKSKLAAEEFVQRFNSPARIVILRPTNVVDRNKNSIIGLSKFKTILKGGENANIVHAEDVAAAALYFIEHQAQNNPDCFIVSCDQEKMNTVAGCLALIDAIKSNSSLENVKPLFHLPWIVPYIVRRLLKGPCNRSDVCYSSNKLLSAGFTYQRGFIGALRDLCANS